MPSIDEAIASVNRVFREFKRYTGDGEPGEPTNAPLPGGDPQSGPHSPKKSSIREMWTDALQAVKDARDAIAAGAVADGAITEPKHATGGVSSRALAALSVITSKIANAAVTLAKLGADVVAEFSKVDPNGPRIPFRYYGPTASQIVGVRFIAMGGFRAGGRYKVGRAPVFAMPAYLDGERNIIDWGNGTSTAGNLFAEAFHVKSNPYANFAAANDGDATATLGVMPYLRVGSIAGSVITLNQAGENQRSIAGKTYQFTTNGLVGADVLVITETKDSRPNGFSYRMTTVTANTQTTVTLADVGSMGAYDYFLVAPPGYDHYCYIHTGYMDTAEIRNIADTGTFVGTRGAQNTQANLSGTVTTPVEVPCDGHISPLATAVAFSHGDSHSTSSGGDCVIRYGMDNGNHDTHEFYYQKDGSASQAFTFMFSPVPFSFFPKIYFYSGGGLNGPTCTRAMNIRGWIEP